MMILSIDIGFKKPGIVLISKEEEKAVIKVYTNLSFDTRADSIKIWEYFFSQKIDKVVIEQQHINSPKNFAFMGFIEGFFLAKGVAVSIVRPFASYRKTSEPVTRTTKKSFSVEYLNQMLIRDKIDISFLKGDSDICDAINIGMKNIGLDSIKRITFHHLC